MYNITQNTTNNNNNAIEQGLLSAGLLIFIFIIGLCYSYRK